MSLAILLVWATAGPGRPNSRADPSRSGNGPEAGTVALARGVRVVAREFIGHNFFLADLNGDRRTDILVMSAGGDRGWIYFNEGTAEAPRFGPPERAPFNISETRPEGISTASVCVVDWNNDGAPDLLCVDNDPWALTICMNTGTTQSPNWWTAYAVPGTLQYAKTDAWRAASVFVADWDGDGRKDILLSVIGRTIHKSEGGRLFFYPNVGTDAAPRFEKRIEIKDEAGGSVLAPRPFVVDWDADGTPDVVAGEEVSQQDGNGTASVLVYRGRRGKPAVVAGAAPVTDAHGKAIRPGRLCQVHDWDGDGRLDLLVLDGSAYALTWYRNVGTPKVPRFAPAPQTVPVEGFARVEGCFDPWFSDFDGDGVADLLLSGSADIWCAGYPFHPRIRFFRGLSRQAPLFAAGTFMTRKGDVVLPSKWPSPGPRCHPVDFNGDKAGDLIYGFRKEGLLVMLGDARTARTLDFVGEAVVPLQDTPTGRAIACDADGDGLWDLLVATGEQVRYFRNRGTRQEPRFGEFQTLRTPDGGAIRASRAAVADLDGDGRGDLIAIEGPAGGQPSLHWYPNRSTGAELSFASPRKLTYGPARRPLAFDATVANLALWAGDLTGDGVADLVLCGDFYDLKGGGYLWRGEMWFFRGLPTAAAIPTPPRLVRRGGDFLEIAWEPLAAPSDVEYELAWGLQPPDELTWPAARRTRSAKTQARFEGLEAGAVYHIAVRPLVGGRPGHLSPILKAATPPRTLLTLRQGAAIPAANVSEYTGCRDVQIHAGSQRDTNLDGQGLCVSGNRAYFGEAPPLGKPDLADPAGPDAERYRRFLIAFDLTPLPKDAKIESARLRLFLRRPDYIRSPLIARQVSPDWDESGATWMQFAKGGPWKLHGGDPGAYAGIGRVERYEMDAPYCWDVTDAARGARAHGKPLSLLVLDERPLIAARREFFDSEAADPCVRPALEVVLEGR